MSVERFVHRCRQVFRGELNLEMIGSWVNQCFDIDVPVDDDKVFVTGMLECRMCGERRVYTWPVDVLDEDAMECDCCGHMTAEPVADDRIEIVVTP